MKKNIFFIGWIIILGVLAAFVSLGYAQSTRYACVDPKTKSARMVNIPKECPPPQKLIAITQQGLDSMVEEQGLPETPGPKPLVQPGKEPQTQGVEKRARFRKRCGKFCSNDPGYCIWYCCYGDYGNCQITKIVTY
jgi:hypothetical protein